MILSDSEIVRLVKSGDIVIDPFKQEHVGPNSYDLTLGTKFLTYRFTSLDSKMLNPMDEHEVKPDTGILLWPDRIYLAHTQERAGSYVYAPMVEGRSSYGRLGLDVHISAGFGDVGFVGQWTLELRVVQPLRVYPNQRICQIYFHKVQGTVVKPYVGKYKDSASVNPSKLHEELHPTNP